MSSSKTPLPARSTALFTPSTRASPPSRLRVSKRWARTPAQSGSSPLIRRVARSWGRSNSRLRQRWERGSCISPRDPSAFFSPEGLDVLQGSRMSPKTLARTTGAFSLLVLLGGIVAQGVIANGLVVPRDAAATATNILAQPKLWALGFTIFLVEMAAQTAMTTLFYLLLKPASGTAALLSLAFGLVGCTIKTLARAFYYAPLLVLGGLSYLSVFDTGQLQALSLLLIKINNQIAGIALVFFGISTFFHGYLIVKSTFLPRFLGIIAIVSGLGWLTWAYPALGSALFYPLIILAMLGLLLTSGWLLVRGVDEQRWREMADRG